MSDYFPPELTEKIFLKLPAKSLIRFTTVCKSWRSVITNPSFISSYLYKPINETLLFRRYDIDDNQEHYYLLEVSKNRPLTITSSSQLEFPLKPLTGILLVKGYCRGVMCLSNNTFSSNQTIILCNPCINKHVVLPKVAIHSEFPRFSALGFGVAAEDHDDFKVVRLVYSVIHSARVGSTQPEAEVFSLRKGRWRRVGIDVRFHNLRLAHSHVFLNGVMHWIGYKDNPVKGFDVSILLFRVAQEAFDEIMLPKGLSITKGHRLTMTLFGESLAVIRFGEDGSCEVWLMKEYGVEESWTRLYSFKLVQGMTDLVALRENGEVLMGTQGFELVSFDLENLEPKNLGIRGIANSFYVENYVESLELLLTGVSGNLMELSEDVEES